MQCKNRSTLLAELTSVETLDVFDRLKAANFSSSVLVGENGMLQKNYRNSFHFVPTYSA